MKSGGPLFCFFSFNIKYCYLNRSKNDLKPAFGQLKSHKNRLQWSEFVIHHRTSKNRLRVNFNSLDLEIGRQPQTRGWTCFQIIANYTFQKITSAGANENLVINHRQSSLIQFTVQAIIFHKIKWSKKLNCSNTCYGGIHWVYELFKHFWSSFLRWYEYEHIWKKRIPRILREKDLNKLHDAAKVW